MNRVQGRIQDLKLGVAQIEMENLKTGGAYIPQIGYISNTPFL